MMERGFSFEVDMEFMLLSRYIYADTLTKAINKYFEVSAEEPISKIKIQEIPTKK